jgi:hypothetical protein
MRCIKNFNLSLGKDFVSKSAKFLSPSTFATRMMPAAIASLTLWYALCFFFKVDDGMLALITTGWLSQKTLA